MAKIVLLCASVLAAAGIGKAALAQHMNAPNAPCRRAAVTTDLALCFSRALKTADQDLNQLYGRAEKALAPPDRESLARAQRLWLRYRDATCSAEGNLYVHGTGAGPAQLACLEALTRERVTDLEASYGWRIEKFDGQGIADR